MKKKRSMSERKAWLFIAEILKKATKPEDNLYFEIDCQIGVYRFVGSGICDLIYDMEKFGFISKSIADRMMSKIQIAARRHRQFQEHLVDEENVSFYLWYHDKKGMNDRVRFCLAQAKKLERKKK